MLSILVWKKLNAHTAGMATRRPNAVVMSASATPAEMAPMPPAPLAAMPTNALTIPIVVPSRPTNGAVAPTVASTPRPRLSSTIVISISRSTARSAELMSATVTLPSWISGLISERALPSTRATCDFL